MKTSESIKNIASAIVNVQREIKKALKDSENPHFRSKFANLESVWEACREQLAAYEIAVIQPFSTENGGCLDTVLLHSSGEWIMGTQILNEIKRDPQATGSATTYARRYGLSAMLGIIQTDDDAEAAMGRNEKTPDEKPGPTHSEMATMKASILRFDHIDQLANYWEKFVAPHTPTMKAEDREDLIKIRDQAKNKLKGIK